ncbi:unnamed protein product, partial [Dovyalis caffra]
MDLEAPVKTSIQVEDIDQKICYKGLPQPEERFRSTARPLSALHSKKSPVRTKQAASLTHLGSNKTWNTKGGLLKVIDDFTKA